MVYSRSNNCNTKDFFMFGTLPNHHLQLFVYCDVWVITNFIPVSPKNG